APGWTRRRAPPRRADRRPSPCPSRAARLAGSVGCWTLSLLTGRGYRGARCHRCGSDSHSTSKGENMLSARNQFKGTVKSVKLGEVMAEIVVTVGGLEIVSAITRTSAESLGLKAGDQVKTIIKSTEVLIDKP